LKYFSEVSVPEHNSANIKTILDLHCFLIKFVRGITLFRIFV
jgi:hypothetical protein